MTHWYHLSGPNFQGTVNIDMRIGFCYSAQRLFKKGYWHKFNQSKNVYLVCYGVIDIWYCIRLVSARDPSLKSWTNLYICVVLIDDFVDTSCMLMSG